MTGYVLAWGTCFACGFPFSFNPHKVPSIRFEGEREPVCGPCMEIVNTRRVASGMDPHPIEDDAYEPLPEHDL